MSTDNTRGIFLMLAAVAAFAVLDTSLKQLAQAYDSAQVVCMRALASIPFFLLPVAITGQWRTLKPVRWSGHLIRGALAIAMLWLFVYGVRGLPLSTAYGIFLSAPLLITALSALVLREHVGAYRWLAIACGIAGVIIILNPSGKDIITLAGLAVFGAAFCYAVTALMIRGLARTDSSLSIALSFMVIVATVTGMVAYPKWQPIFAGHWPWIITLGLSGALGQYLIVLAFRAAPPSVIAPFEYTALLWGIAFDWFLWNVVPGTRVLAGAAVVVTAGMYVIYREHWLNRQRGPLIDHP